MCSAYGGLLKGFLTSPQVSSPIETPQDVCIKFTIGDFSKYKANAKVVANTQLKVELNSFDWVLPANLALARLRQIPKYMYNVQLSFYMHIVHIKTQLNLNSVLHYPNNSISMSYHSGYRK